MISGWNDPQRWRTRLVIIRGAMTAVLGILLWAANSFSTLPIPAPVVYLWLLLLLSPSLLYITTLKADNNWQWQLLGIELMLDQVFFLGLLHQLGGSTNPIAYYLLVPILLGALALPFVPSLLQTMVAIGGYAITLRWHLIPQDNSHLHSLTQELHPAHGLGMWVAFSLIAIVLTALAQLLRTAEQREHRRQATALNLALQRERMYQVAATLADQAHELNTPLNSMLLIGENLQQHPELPVAMQNSIRQLIGLIERIANVLRPGRADPGGNARAIHLSELVKQVRQSMKHLAPMMKISLKPGSDPALTHPEIWQRVLHNLAYNACDAGASCLTIACMEADEATLLRVTDDGPAQQQQYHREGLGIGLALTETSLAALGATLSLSCSETETRVDIYLPGKPER